MLTCPCNFGYFNIVKRVTIFHIYARNKYRTFPSYLLAMLNIVGHAKYHFQKRFPDAVSSYHRPCIASTSFTKSNK